MIILEFLALLILAILCLAILLISIIFSYLTVSSGFMRSSPAVPSHGRIKDAIIEEAAAILQQASTPQTVMDLGSGWGTLLIPLAKRFPNHRFIGIELSALPFRISRLRARNLHNLTFVQQDFFSTNLSEANLIFVFLLHSTMAKLTTKIQTEMPTGGTIIANRFPMKNIEADKTVSLGSDYYTYYVYHQH